ncbi:unnamed protein product [Adineta ricciae]|uniref:TIR domain-containing protein n=1 Tax=Adineta ricciae TaxID=249248 RepID=A0A815H0Q1_ADIRI|nr:unnamed protein product [Adineta ricciae]CAF1423199.1 unnamed protein product [Adineta ricciae]
MTAAASQPTEKLPVVFSYSDCGGLVDHVYNYLKPKLEFPVWMDKHDAHSGSFSSSLASAIEKCGALVCFLTPEYQETSACERELTYAANQRKIIIPVIVGKSNAFDASNDEEEDDEDDDEEDWFPNDWLGLIVADLSVIYFDGVTKENIGEKCDELKTRIENTLKNTIAPATK